MTDSSRAPARRSFHKFRWMMMAAGLATPLGFVAAAAVAEQFNPQFGPDNGGVVPAAYAKPATATRVATLQTTRIQAAPQMPPEPEATLAQADQPTAASQDTLPPAMSPFQAEPGPMPGAIMPEGARMPPTWSEGEEGEYIDDGCFEMQPNYISPTALAPNMFGDETGVGRNGLFINGALSASLSLPNMAFNHLNIAENNSPVARDRAYFSLRRYQNVTPLELFANSPQGGSVTLDIDRVTMGFERRLTEYGSIEFRAPISNQAGSSLSFAQGAPNFGNTPIGGPYDTTVNNIADLDAREWKFGNLGVILKQGLLAQDWIYLSGGFGFNIPTADDVTVNGTIDDDNFPIFSVTNPTGVPLAVVDANLSLSALYRNETVNIQPFLAAVIAPDENWFVQGFAQVDVPVNQSEAALNVNGSITNGNVTTPFAQSIVGDLGQQVMVRVNGGLGRWFIFDDGSTYIRRAGLVVEAHYVTCLTDADIARTQALDLGSDFDGDGANDTVQVSLGALRNRTDIVNIVVGTPLMIGQTTVYPSVTIPVDASNGNDTFDASYNFTLDRRF